jgi:hypothetical protein
MVCCRPADTVWGELTKDDRMNDTASGGRRWTGARGARGGRAGGAARGPAVACEPLESRVLLSKTGPLVDAGDVRWLYSLNRPEHLLRATDEVVVGFEPSGARRVHRLGAALTAKGAALDGYVVLQAFDVTSVVFRRVARGSPPTLDVLGGKIAGFPAVKHLSPTFLNVTDHKRLIVFDTVYVDLRAGVDAAKVFAEGYAGYTPSVGDNAFSVKLERGGAIDALRTAERLRTKSFVEGTDAELASMVWLS